jgi:hypothetical protein
MVEAFPEHASLYNGVEFVVFELLEHPVVGRLRGMNVVG